jgi:uncharacterized protein
VRPGEHAEAQGAIALGAGALFAVGLAIAGMTQPGKVLGFLDLFGAWDPTLMFVMVGAIAVHAPIYWLLVRRRPAPPFATAFSLPTRRDVDRRLIVGALLFGIGWGIAGFCPGPALASLGKLSPTVLVFVAAMVGGMLAHHGFERSRAAARDG